MYWYYLDDGRAINLAHATEILVEEDGQYLKAWAILKHGDKTIKYTLKKFAERNDANNFILELIRKMNVGNDAETRESLAKLQNSVMDFLLIMAKSISDE